MTVGLGVAMTLWANTVRGIAYGPAGIVVSGWPPVALIAAIEVLARMVRPFAPGRASRTAGLGGGRRHRGSQAGTPGVHRGRQPRVAAGTRQPVRPDPASGCQVAQGGGSERQRAPLIAMPRTPRRSSGWRGVVRVGIREARISGQARRRVQWTHRQAPSTFLAGR